MAIKTCSKFGSTTATAGETISETADGSSSGGGPAWGMMKNACRQMDVLINVKTLTGTNIYFSIQEQFSDVGFIETGRSQTITATGKYLVSFDGQTGQSAEPNISYGHGMLGKGHNKQIVTTTTALTALSADIYLLFSQ